METLQEKGSSLDQRGRSFTRSPRGLSFPRGYAEAGRQQGAHQPAVPPGTVGHAGTGTAGP